MGSFLKLWLTNSEKLKSEESDHMRRLIHGVLDRKVTMHSSHAQARDRVEAEI